MNYTYTICSLAVGESYTNTIFNTFKNIRNLTPQPQLLAVTDSKISVPQDINVVDSGLYPTHTKDNRFFNYNLKFAPIKHSIPLNTDYIVFIDADWSINEGFTDKCFYELFHHMESHNIDFVFERPHQIGASKRNLSGCFWSHKIEPFGLNTTNKYDTGHVCNEQCLVFKNNKKLQVFIESWELLFNKVFEESVWPFAEGVEIGMAAVEAEMNWDWSSLSYLQRCFSFHTYDGTYLERF